MSTFMLLVALQDMVKSQCRVMGEIHQGMDERNDLLAFERIVKSSVGPKWKQSFNITLKLLPGTTAIDHENVTTNVVNNGLYNSNSVLWDLDNFTDKKNR